MTMTRGIKFFFIAFFINLFFWLGVNFFQNNLENFFYAQISQPLQNIPELKIPPKPQKPELELAAKSAISVEIKKNGKEITVFEKDIEKILPLASLTKLMTALVFLSNGNSDLENTWISVSYDAARQENVPNYGNLKTGEKLNLKQLFDLMLIYSSNDAAFAISELLGVDNFVSKMNQKAKELSLTNTYFVNPTGLDPENLHYSGDASIFFNRSTAKDLVKLTQYLLKNYPLIFEVSLQKGPYPFMNGVSNLSLPESETFWGGKTGYTDEAGGCIVSIFQNKKGNIFFNIILGAPSQTARVEEMQKLIDWLNL